MEHSPRLTIISSSSGTAFGGLETYVINEARYLSGPFRIQLLVGRGPLTDDFKSLATRPDAISCHTLPFIPRSSPLSAMPRIFGLNGMINSFDIEALSLLPSLWGARRLLNGSDIVEVHYAPESFIFPFINKQAKKIIHFHGPWLPPIYRRLKNSINPSTDMLVTCSDWSRREMERLYGIEGVNVVYNGVDEDLFRPRAESLFEVAESYDKTLPRVGTVGRLGEAKGTDLLVEAAKEAEGKAEFFAVGPCEAGFLRRMDEIGVPGNFHFLGPLPNGRLPEFYNFIDCFVLPSQFEAFGITVLEAMSSGTPVIASRTGGVPEIIDDRVDGILVPPLDRVALRDSIRSVIENKDRRGLMAGRAREKVLSRFTHKRSYDSLMLLHERTLDG